MLVVRFQILLARYCEQIALNESHNETVQWIAEGNNRTSEEETLDRRHMIETRRNEQRNAIERGMDTAKRIYTQSLGSFVTGGPKSEQFCIHKAGNGLFR